jgi:hypothetical protein
MNGTEHQTFKLFLDSVDQDLGRDPESLYLFEWVVEERYNKIIETSYEYFIERPDLMALQKEEIEWELNAMLNYFESIEEFEKCSKLLKIKKEIEYIIKEY